jgi:hypothetical protein
VWKLIDTADSIMHASSADENDDFDVENPDYALAAVRYMFLLLFSLTSFCRMFVSLTIVLL